MTKAAATLPPMPGPDELEGLAKTPAGGRWVTALAAAHILGAPARRDAHTGAVLPQPLGTFLAGVRTVLAGPERPLPADPIQLAARFLAGPLRTILHGGRAKIVRRHMPRPLHQLREMDAACAQWLGRQPGRTVREKLAGRASALGVVREFSPDTHENRVVRRVVRTLGEWVARRLEAAAESLYDGTPEDLGELELCHELCAEDLPLSPLVDVPAALNPDANNVLLRDRNYSRVWRAWQWLARLPGDYARWWERCEEWFRVAAFWTVAARLAGTPGVRAAEGICRVKPGFGDDGFGVEQLAAGELEAIPLCSITFTVEPLLPSPRHRRGRIKRLSRNYQGAFGFVCDDSGRDHYLQPAELVESVAWEDLREGDEVYFVPGPAPARGMRNTLPPARSVELPGGAFTVTLRLDGSALEATVSPLVGTACLQADFERAWCRRYEIGLSHAQPAARRGMTLAVRVAEAGGVRHHPPDVADVGGLRALAETVARDLIPGPPPRPSVEPGATPRAFEASAPLGIDLGTVRPAAAQGGSASDLTTLSIATPYDIEGATEWLVPRVGHWVEFRPNVPLATGVPDLLGGGGNSAEAEAAARRAVEDVRTELAGDGLLTQVAYAVPDALDEWSQQSLRQAVSSALRGALPVRRSVAAALGLQVGTGFPRHGVCPDDVVVALDLAGVTPAATVLVARHHAALGERFPPTGGVYWERRACVTPDALPEELAERANGLTADGFYRAYAHGVLEGHVPEEWLSTFVDLVVRTGAVEEVLRTGRDAWLPLSVDGGLGTFRLGYHREILVGVCGEWSRRLAAFVAGLGVSEVFVELVDGVRAEKRKPSLLLFGPQFDLEEARAATRSLAAGAFRRLLPDLPHRLVALGAEHCLTRLAAGLPAWHDWLPELHLEVIRDGHFHELELMRAQRLGPNSQNQILGQGLTVRIDEPLILPPGHHAYRFPLLIGPRRDRLPFDAVLDDPRVLPLSRPADVGLELSYRYGLDSAYALSVLPADAAGFSRLEVTWKRRREPVSLPPRCPPRGRGRRRTTEELQNWLRGSAASFVDACQRYLGEGNRPEQFAAFCRQTVNRWNAKQPARVVWPEPTTQDLQLAVLAEWARRTLEFPVGELCKRGSLRDDAVRQVVEDQFLPWLDCLAVPAPTDQEPATEMPTGAGWETLSGAALRLLARFYGEDPDALLGRVAQALARPRPAVFGEWHATDAGAHLVGASREALDRVLDWILRAFDPQPGTPLLPGSLAALSRALWRYPHVSPEIPVPWIGTFLQAAERRLREDLAALPADGGGHDRAEVFGLLCEVTFGLLQRRSQERCPRLLAAGAPGLSRIAWLVRRLDAVFADRGLPVAASEVRVSEPPPELYRMSALAYALNTFLTGEAECNLIQLAANEEEDGSA